MKPEHPFTFNDIPILADNNCPPYRIIIETPRRPFYFYLPDDQTDEELIAQAVADRLLDRHHPLHGALTLDIMQRAVDAAHRSFAIPTRIVMNAATRAQYIALIESERR